MLGKRLYVEVEDAHYLTGEWVIVDVDPDDLELPYRAKHMGSGNERWMTPRFHIGLVQGDEQTIVELD